MTVYTVYVVYIYRHLLYAIVNIKTIYYIDEKFSRFQLKLFNLASVFKIYNFDSIYNYYNIIFFTLLHNVSVKMKILISISYIHNDKNNDENIREKVRFLPNIYFYPILFYYVCRKYLKSKLITIQDYSLINSK